MKKPAPRKNLHKNLKNRIAKANNRKAVQPVREKPVNVACAVQLLGRRWKNVACAETMELSVIHKNRAVPLCHKHWMQFSDSDMQLMNE